MYGTAADLRPRTPPATAQDCTPLALCQAYSSCSSGAGVCLCLMVCARVTRALPVRHLYGCVAGARVEPPGVLSNRQENRRRILSRRHGTQGHWEPWDWTLACNVSLVLVGLVCSAISQTRPEGREGPMACTLAYMAYLRLFTSCTTAGLATATAGSAYTCTTVCSPSRPLDARYLYSALPSI